MDIRRVVARNGTAAPHTLQMMRLYLLYRCMLHELGANVPIQSRAAVRPRQLPDGKYIASRAGCWLRSTAQGHSSPSVTVQAFAIRCVGRHSQNRGKRACFAAVGWDGASWTQLSHHSTLARARAPSSPRKQPSCAMSHPEDTRHMALGGAMVPTIISARSTIQRNIHPISL
jgi:hypothetical protein